MTTPLTAVDTDWLDELHAKYMGVSVGLLKGYPEYEEYKAAINAHIGTIAEQIIGDDEKYNSDNAVVNMERAIKNGHRAEQRQRKAQLLSTPAPQDGSATPEAPERLKDYMENTQ